MKKRLVLKDNVKVILVVLLGMVALVGCVKLLAAQNQYEYNKAIDRCGGKDNIVLKYTVQGDEYYSCTIVK